MSAYAAPTAAIAAYVHDRGAASSAEIFERFGISRSTLRRRRPELARLGVTFVENGNRSYFERAGLTSQLRTNYRPSANQTAFFATEREQARTSVRRRGRQVSGFFDRRRLPSRGDVRKRPACPQCGRR